MNKEAINKNYFDLAVKRITKSNISINKMKEYLSKKGASEIKIEEVIRKLTHYNLLNEDELIKEIIRYADNKHYGYNRIIKMLLNKKVSISKIENVTMDISREEKHALEMIKRLIKAYKDKKMINVKQKIYSSLIRYGFDENIAYMQVNKVFNPSMLD